MSDTVYISFQKNTQVNNRRVSIGDVASVWCGNKHVLARVKAITVINVPDVPSRRYVISAVKIVELIVNQIENAQVNLSGEADFIISYKSPQPPKRLLQLIKIILVAAVVFCGGSFAIMAYGNDVDINGVLTRICEYTTGDNDLALWIIQIAYSVGIMLGIIVFYNHLGKRRYEKDPTPLEVEMRLYEEDINTAVINESAREEKEDDVV